MSTKPDKPSCRTYHLWTLDGASNYTVVHNKDLPMSTTGGPLEAANNELIVGDLANDTNDYSDYSNDTTINNSINNNDDIDDGTEKINADMQISSSATHSIVDSLNQQQQQHQLSARLLTKYKDYLRRYSMALEANQDQRQQQQQQQLANNRQPIDRRSYFDVKQFTFACVAYEANPVKNLQFYWRLNNHNQAIRSSHQPASTTVTTTTTTTNSQNKQNLADSTSYLIPRQIALAAQGGNMVWSIGGISLRLINRLDLDQLSLVTIELRHNESSSHDDGVEHEHEANMISSSDNNNNLDGADSERDDEWGADWAGVRGNGYPSNNNNAINNKRRPSTGSTTTGKLLQLQQATSWRQQLEELLTCSVANEIGMSPAAPVRLSRPSRTVQTPSEYPLVTLNIILLIYCPIHGTFYQLISDS